MEIIIFKHQNIIMLLSKINLMNGLKKEFLKMHLKNIIMMITILIYFTLIQLLFIILKVMIMLLLILKIKKRK